MKQTMQIILLLLLLPSLSKTFSQWTKVKSIPTNDIILLTVSNNNIYAASDSTEIYKSSDMGITWNTLTVSSSPIDITSLIFFNNKIYVGTFRFGIFSSSDNGSIWQKSNSNLVSISDFAVKDNLLYASTFGDGVAVLDTNTNQWSFINDSLPSYSVNVQKIIGHPNFLIIAAGANGTYYKYNFSTHSWDESFYYGILRPGLQINNLINDGNTIFAVNGNRIIKSSNAGESWVDDKIGTHNGFYRNIYAGLNTYYILTNLITGGTWIQKRDKYLNSGTTWGTKEEFLPSGFSYDIIEYNNKLFLAKDDGLYVKSITGDDSVPVELISFTARVNNNGSVVLNWSTASEINNQMFEIERASSSTMPLFDEWVRIGFVEGYGTSTEQKAYFYIDNSVKTGSYYYRLKQVDFSGEYKYSNVIEIEVNGPLTFGLEQNYPNPFNPSTLIKYSVPGNGFIKLSVYNLIGEEVKVLVNNEVDSGFYEVIFNAENLPSGTYFYRLQSGNTVQLKKMLLMK